MRLRSLTHIATVLVLQAAGAGLASSTLLVSSLVEVSGEVPGSKEMTDVSQRWVPMSSSIDWLPKDNQSVYVLDIGEIKRSELNSTALKGVPVFITVSPCGSNLVWSVYHDLKNKSREGWRLLREYRNGETNTFTAVVWSEDRYIVQLRGGGGRGAAAAVWARGERGEGVQARLRLRGKRRLAVNWGQSPIDPQETSYCVVASTQRPYTSLCAARHDCGAQCLSDDCACRGDIGYNAVGQTVAYKNYVRRRKHSRSTKLSDTEPLVVCVGSTTHHVFENIELSKTYHVSVFAVGRTRRSGVMIGKGTVQPRLRTRPRLLTAGAVTRIELRGKAVFYYKPKPYSEGVWLGVVACDGAVDIEVAARGKRLHSVRNIDHSTKIYIPTISSSSSIQSEENYSYSSSSEEVPRYLIRVTNSRGFSKKRVMVEVSISANNRDLLIAEFQPRDGNIVRELRPMRNCSSIHVAFLPIKLAFHHTSYASNAPQVGTALLWNQSSFNMHYRTSVSAPAPPCVYIQTCLARHVLSGHSGTQCAIQCNQRNGCRYCFLVTEMTEETRSPARCPLDGPQAPGTNCVEQVYNQKVITKSIDNLKPGTKYSIIVTASSKDRLLAHYAPLYADTYSFCD